MSPERPPELEAGWAIVTAVGVHAGSFPRDRRGFAILTPTDDRTAFPRRRKDPTGCGGVRPSGMIR